MWSEAAEDMRAINVWVSRARLALEAGGKLDLEDLGSNLEHAMELGLRNDGAMPKPGSAWNSAASCAARTRRGA